MYENKAKPGRTIAIALGMAAAAAALIGGSIQSASAETTVSSSGYIGYPALGANGSTSPYAPSTNPYQRACTEITRCARG